MNGLISSLISEHNQYLLLMQRRKICRYFERGSCKKENCPFVHLKENRKNCTFYMEGNCRKGANCNFYHPPREEEKLASLKEELKAKKNVKPKKEESQEEEIEEIREMQVKPQPKQEVKIEQAVKQVEAIAENVKKEEVKEQEIEQPETKEMNQNSKIQKINFLLGLNEEDSESSSSDEEQIEQAPKKQQIQFVKIFPKKFPDFSKTADMKAKILENEKKYFKGEKYLTLITKIEDPIEKEYYQIIRKFTDHFQPQQGQPKLFTLRIRPLIYDKEINLHFDFVQDTLDLTVDMTQYPQSPATFTVTNKSVPQEYKLKFADILKRTHSKISVFQTLKYLQNNFEKIYGESKFRLENEHYSKKELQRKLKEEKKAPKVESSSQEPQVKKKKVRRDPANEHPDVRIVKYKEGEKIDHLNFNYEISVDSIVLQNCEYVVVEKMLVYIECVCEKKIVYLFDATNDRSLVVGVKLVCKKCHNLIVLGLEREVVQVRKDVLGRIGVNYGHLIDVGGVSFKIGCQCSSQISKARLYLPGERITANCHQCFSTMLIIYMGLKSYNFTIKGVQIKVDTQLPNKGACKHMKLTFRWFRYGCCGRCFSCDDCHIMESCAVHEKIKGITMVCGYCSREQAIGNDCAFCHKQLQKGMDKSGHWQGGMGCRDQALLSRKDAKKYTGLTKHKEKEK